MFSSSKDKAQQNLASSTLLPHTIQPSPVKPLPVIGRSFPEGTLGPLFPFLPFNPYIDANPSFPYATLPGGELPPPIAKKIWACKPQQELHLNIEDFKTIEINTGYVDIPYKIILVDYGQLKSLRKWDTITIKGRLDPNIRYLVTHRRLTSQTTADIQLNAYTHNGRCVQSYDSEWPALILVIGRKYGLRVPQAPFNMQNYNPTGVQQPGVNEDVASDHEDDCYFCFGECLVSGLAWICQNTDCIWKRISPAQS